jgi:hypothetical protein
MVLHVYVLQYQWYYNRGNTTIPQYHGTRVRTCVLQYYNTTTGAILQYHNTMVHVYHIWYHGTRVLEYVLEYQWYTCTYYDTMETMPYKTYHGAYVRTCVRSTILLPQRTARAGPGTGLPLLSLHWHHGSTLYSKLAYWLPVARREDVPWYCKLAR